MTTPFREPEAQALYMVRGFEESDREGVLPQAPEVTGRSGEAPRDRLVRRAIAMQQTLDRDYPFLPGLRRTTSLRGGFGPAVVAIGLAIGLASTWVSSTREINLLSPPVLGLVVWNLAVYLAVALGWLVGGRWRPGRGLPRLVPPVITLRSLRRLLRRLRGHLPERQSGLVGRALRLFLGDWREAARPLVEARSRRLFHLGSAALGLGVVVGLYARGLVQEYRVTWESTFLTPETAERLVEMLVAPARLLAPVATPAFAAVQAPATGEAAGWVHLLCLTVGLFVVAPRLGLAGLETVAAMKMGRVVPVDLGVPYFRRLLVDGPVRLVMQPYSYTMAAEEREALTRAARLTWGDDVQTTWNAPLEYGAEALPELGPETHEGVLLFNAAQTPESEVHAALTATAESRWRLVVDLAPYRRRVGADSPERVHERGALWPSVVGSRARCIDTGGDVDELARRLADEDEQ